MTDHTNFSGFSSQDIEIRDLKKALLLACTMIADAIGACPLDTFDWDNDCDNCKGDSTGENEAQCYADYCLWRAKEGKI